MWVRKSESKLNDEERAQARARYSPLLPLFLGSLAGAIALLWEQSWGFFASVTGIAFILLYAWRVVFGDRHLLDFAGVLLTPGTITISQDTCICPACRKPQLPRKEGCLACGTPLEEISRWEWVRGKKAHPPGPA